ncbi:MAG: MYG1 family protein [Oscillochloris sp.]|nr:MYG1 family protein [Oscillochloris sp.]
MVNPKTIVGHLAPDLDCLAAIWILVRFGHAKDAELTFVPAGRTLDNQIVDADPAIVHVDTGGGRFDHHHTADTALSAAELVRRDLAPDNEALRRLVDQVTRIDHAEASSGRQPVFFNINDLIAGYNALYPNRPHHVAQAMLPNLDAWYEHELREVRLERAFARRLEFRTRWGLGIAMQSDDGASSRLAYSYGAVLYVYRDRRGYMGVAAQHRSDVDLETIYRDLQRLDAEADWYLHPSHRLLLCGTPKAPPRQCSALSLEDLVAVLQSGCARAKR